MKRKRRAREATRTEIRDGKVFTVTVLPEAKPPEQRSKRTRYHLVDVRKAGNK